MECSMDEEIEALKHNKTWTISNLFKDQKVVWRKWVYAIKYKPNKDVDGYKAKLVAKGCIQDYGIDYFENAYRYK